MCIITRPFSLYCESIFRLIKDIPGIAVGGHIINNQRYADDTVLLARNEMKLQKLVDKVVTESNNKGLSLNIKKTSFDHIKKADFDKMHHHSKWD